MTTNEDKNELKEYLFKEVEIIQGIINRMGFNSFIIKGWAISLVVVTLLLKGESYHIWIAIIPLVIFWALDAFFIQQERMYRQLYNWVINNRLKSREKLLDMNAYRFKKQVSPIYKIMISKTLGLFYGSITILLAILMFIIIMNEGGINIW